VFVDANVQVPVPEHALGQALEIVLQTLSATLHI
jgi:hypothetical protein